MRENGGDSTEDDSGSAENQLCNNRRGQFRHQIWTITVDEESIPI